MFWIIISFIIIIIINFIIIAIRFPLEDWSGDFSFYRFTYQNFIFSIMVFHGIVL